ncbi:MAG: hypothetical protein ABJH68_14780 [Ilumatobacter sp.]|uniref:hypothetical protein n=1 Tax=Ilumatobacter sp. TaxID=1967498 RepID=UPI003299D672
MSQDSFGEVFEAARAVMVRHADDLVVTAKTPAEIVVEGVVPGANGRLRWYGAVQTKKNYVSYHLMPV